MQNAFNFYHKQNETILKIVLLPFTLILWAIKKLVKVITKRLVNRKH